MQVHMHVFARKQQQSRVSESKTVNPSPKSYTKPYREATNP